MTPWRIRSQATFTSLRHARARVKREPVGVVYVPAATGRPQVAYAVGRAVGNAVTRNRLRRRVRAIVAECAPWLPPGAYLVHLGPGCIGLSYLQLQAELREALRTVVEKSR